MVTVTVAWKCDTVTVTVTVTAETLRTLAMSIFQSLRLKSRISKEAMFLHTQ